MYRLMQALAPTTRCCEGTGVAFDGTFTMSYRTTSAQGTRKRANGDDLAANRYTVMMAVTVVL